MQYSPKSKFKQIFEGFRNSWAQIDPFLFNIFSKDFPTQSRAQLNYLHNNEKSTFLTGCSIVKNDRKRVNNLQFQYRSDLLIHLLEGNRFWLKVSAEDLKVHCHYNLSKESENKINWQPYLSFSSTRKFSSSSFKFGAIRFFNNGSVDLRFRYNIGQYQADYFCYAKGNYKNTNIRLSGILATLIKNNQINLQKNDIMASVKLWQRNWVGIILSNEQFRKYRINYSRLGSYFDSLKAAYFYSDQNLHLGLLYEYSIEDSISKKIQAAVQYNWKYTSQIIKAKLNTQWRLGVVVETITPNWKFQIGTSWFNVNQSSWPSCYIIKISY